MSPEVEGIDLPILFVAQGALLTADVAKLPDGSMWFVAGCQDATVHIWKVSPGNMPGRLQIAVTSNTSSTFSITITRFPSTLMTLHPVLQVSIFDAEVKCGKKEDDMDHLTHGVEPGENMKSQNAIVADLILVFLYCCTTFCCHPTTMSRKNT